MPEGCDVASKELLAPRFGRESALLTEHRYLRHFEQHAQLERVISTVTTLQATATPTNPSQDSPAKCH